MQDEEVTGATIGCCYEVAEELGAGFVESVYERALEIALRDQGFEVARQVPVEVWFRGKRVGDFIADLVVAGRVIVELKAVSELAPEHRAQLINYLNATTTDTGLLVNFGSRHIQIKRCHSRRIKRT